MSYAQPTRMHCIFPRSILVLISKSKQVFLILLQMALQPGVGFDLRYNMPPRLSVPCSISPFVCTHLSQVHGNVIQPSHSWSSSSSCCIRLSVQHIFFWDCGVLHSFYMPKPSYIKWQTVFANMLVSVTCFVSVTRVEMLIKKTNHKCPSLLAFSLLFFFSFIIYSLCSTNRRQLRYFAFS